MKKFKQWIKFRIRNWNCEFFVVFYVITWYVSTMHEIQEKKIERRLFSGRIKEISIDNTEKK